VRSRIYRWYARLKEIELQLEDKPGLVRLEDMLQRLEDIDRAVNRIPTPLAYSENLYSFRTHIDLVRQRVIGRLARAESMHGAAAPEASPAAHGGERGR
jgi:hypothetical protein